MWCVCSVVSHSLRPHGLQPAGLLRPWDSPGKKTGVGCHVLLQGMFPTQGETPGLLHCRQILYRLSHQGSTLSVSLFSLPPQFPPHLHLAFKISWRAEEILYRLDVDWPKYSEYFTGATFCVAVDSLNGLVYVAQVSKTGIFVFKVTNAKKTAFLCYCTKYLCTFMLRQLWNLFF